MKVKNYKYLETYENGYTDEEIRQRIGTEGRMFLSIRKGFLNKREVTKKTKITVHKSIKTRAGNLLRTETPGLGFTEGNLTLLELRRFSSMMIFQF